jgi:3'-phosphoadenosine 5'-phosphosulfate sulfotransferase (PAPS reductase)/FAD synthetase
MCFYYYLCGIVLFFMTKEELKERQSWTLDQKIDHSLGVIEQFYNRLGGNVYISFSGGKDSTVLLHLARRLYPDIKAVFVNTGNEFPEIVNFVREKQRGGENIDIIRPKMTPKEVIEQFGFPLVSKEKAQQIYYVRHRPDSVKAQRAMCLDDRYQRIPLRWRYLINEPYDTSSECCHMLKKQPLHDYMKETGRFPIIGTMAEESLLRTQAYIHSGGCNVFNNRDKRKQKSLPLAIWTEKDIYDYISKYNIEIAPIYAKGMNRTGCAFCAFGVTLNNDNRLRVVYDTHPKLYQHFMNYSNNGITYREVLRKLLSRVGMSLPDEENINQQQAFFDFPTE